MEGLDKYVAKARESANERVRGSAEEHVETLLNELRLPWRREPEGDIWTVSSDVGDVLLGLSDDDKTLSIWDLVHPLRGKAKKNADYFADLLRINHSTRGACFALTEVNGQEWVIVLARLAAATLDREELSMALEDVFASLDLYRGDGD